ncbi:conserved hypothetical protein [Culex quinquefasciatus]|uniref:C2H2-type domain-containing protein n=1 Tax=Culex quinquefasciatus TaxID=7176 RepID=B0WTK7_CULQU|nr:conserved hypothetical protein [Culex quinquefasciatus]|eukprot:XP_001854626.1 conserved hypothetical protein [Culex quinquefasciatus]
MENRDGRLREGVLAKKICVVLVVENKGRNLQEINPEMLLLLVLAEVLVAQKLEAKCARFWSRHGDSEKKYKCNFASCDFATRVPGHLKRHLLVHSGTKPYSCPHCDYSCNNIENLRKHVISTSKHKGKYLYECKFCSLHDEQGSNVFKSNFSKDYKDHLMGVHKFTSEKATQVARI